MKFAAEDDLEMRHLKSFDVAVDAVKADVGDVMLAAGIEAAAHLDAQIFHRLVELQTLLAETIAQLARQTARRGDAQFAGVGPRAGRDIDDGRRVRRAQADRTDRLVELR